jgi:hypothetical protein
MYITTLVPEADHLIFNLGLSATDSWMEKLIKKKQKKASTSTSTISTSMAHSKENPFEELNRWFKSRRLEREACPNPIPWWGVCTLVLVSSFRTKFFASINLNILSFV